MSARDFYSDLGVTLPGSAATGSVPVRCFANPNAHQHEDKNASCSVSLDTGQWNCKACGARGSAFDAAEVLGRSRSEAAELAKQHGVFARDREQSNPARPKAGNRQRSAPKLPTEQQVRAWRDALLSDDRIVAQLGEWRGWTREAIDALELGIDRGRVMFATRNAAGQLVGVQHYQPNPEQRTGAKMKAWPGSTRELFPPPETLPADTTAFLTEGEPDAAATRSLGLTAVAIPGARTWRGEWAARFAGRHVVLIPDADTAGRELMAQAARDLVPHAASVRVLDLNPGREDGHDIGDLTREAAHSGPDGLATVRARIERDAAAAPVLEPSAIEPTEDGPPDGRRSRRVVTFTPASAIEHEPVRWLWHGRVPLGAVTVLAGQQGLGKSTTMTELASRATRGKLDGDLAGQPAAALIVTLEDHLASVVKPRLLAAGADLDLVQLVGVNIDGSDGLVTLPDDLDAIEAGVQKHGARLLIVDPIVATLSGGIDAYRDHDVRRALAPLAQLAERCDLAVVAIMHLTKAQTGELLGRVSGSVAFTAAARSLLAFARDPDDPDGDTGDQRVIVHVKSNWGRLAPSLLARIEERQLDVEPPVKASQLVILGESSLTAADFAGRGQDQGDRGDREAAADMIAEELADGEWRLAGDVEAVAVARGISRATLYRAVQALEADRLLERDRGGFPARSRWRSRQLSQPLETTDQAEGCDNWQTPIATGVLAPEQPQLSQAFARETTGPRGAVGEGGIDCVSPFDHAGRHELHPATGRGVCMVCHPPAAVLLSNGWRP